MLLLAVFCQFIAAVTFVLHVEYTPECCIPGSTALAFASTSLSVSRVGFSPSFEVSVARVGFSPSYDLSVSRVGSTPSLFSLSAQCGDSTSSFEPRMCVSDLAEWNESGWCAVGVTPSVFLSWLLGPGILAALFSSICFLVGLFAFVVLRLCASLFGSLCARLFRGLGICLAFGLSTLLFVGLCALSLLGCVALVTVGCLGVVFAFASMLVSVVLVVLLFNFFCACAFFGHNAYNAYLKWGPRACALFAACLWCYFGLGVPLFVFLCAVYYRIICPYFSDRPVDNVIFIDLLSGAGIWVGDVVGDFVRDTWLPMFEFSSRVLFFGSQFLSSFFFYGLYITIFFYCVRPFISLSVFF